MLLRLLRTPDERFVALPGFDYEPEYADVASGDGDDGRLRMGYVQTGPAQGPVVLLLHGEPSWSFLYRRMLPMLAQAGLRAVAPDLVGFGRSDKPTEVADHSYARHVEWVRALAFDVLELTGVTLVGQDWGGLIGLRLVAEHPDRFDAVVAANTGLPTGDQDMPPPWWAFLGLASSTIQRSATLVSPCSNSMSAIIRSSRSPPWRRATPLRNSISTSSRSYRTPRQRLPLRGPRRGCNHAR